MVPRSDHALTVPLLMRSMPVSPVVALRQRMSAVPSPVKSPMPSTDQAFAIVPRLAQSLIVPLLMKSMPVSPSCRCASRMSDGAGAGEIADAEHGPGGADAAEARTSR